MKTLRIIALVFASAFLLAGCCREKDDFWDDTRTASRHMKRGFCSLGGKNGDSRAVYRKEEFMPSDDGYMEEEFIPLEDYRNSDQLTMSEMVPQPREIPGDPNSSLPGIASFRDPNLDPRFAGIFRTVHFDYNSCLVQGYEDLNSIGNIAYYLKQHPEAYLFIEGHCDERGPEAYNLALGARRSNSVRNLLVHEGVHPDHLFTISYGKERPLVYEHHEEAWRQNRRVEFRIYER